MPGILSPNHKSGTNRSLPSLGPVLAILLSVGILLLWHPPVQGWSQVAEIDGQQSLIKLANCYLNNDARPSDASSVDVTTANLIVKTTVLEKITFVCKSSPSQDYVLVDVNVQAKMIDSLESQVSINRSVEIITCIKDINGSVLGCTSETPTKDLPSAKCSLKKPYQRSPTVTSSIASTDASMPVARLEVDSDVFSCRNEKGEQLLKNVVILSEVFEYIQEAKPLKKSTESLSCLTDLNSATVLGCRFQKVF